MAAEMDGDESKDGPSQIEVALRELPEALDRAVYVHERWPLVVDPTGQAARFLKYQRGSFLCTRLPGDMVDTNLRRCLVGALRYASFLVIDVRARRRWARASLDAWSCRRGQLPRACDVLLRRPA